MKLLILLLMFVSPAAAAPPAGRDVDIIASDGIALKATYFAAYDKSASLIPPSIR
jgi:hypothetical protein